MIADALARTQGPVPCAHVGELHLGDCREVLPSLRDNSVDMILTDPPYFLDGLDPAWRKGSGTTPRATGTVGALPVGMKFDPQQGKELQQFIGGVAAEWNRVLVPGAFALVFSQPRLSHRMAVAIEDAGFEIRDMLVWRFTRRAQFKAFAQTHFVERMDIPARKKRQLLASLEGRKTPQLRPQYESIILAQKPREGTFVQNWERWGTGLIDATRTLDGSAPSNVMTVEKPDRNERLQSMGHLTPKPVRLLSHLIELFSREGQIVLDCFLGSGSTAVAAIKAKRRCVGIEINAEYLELAKKRIMEAAQ